MKSQTSLKMDHVRSKTRSLGQISEKPYVHSRGHTLSPIIMKCGQNVCLDEISDRFENESCWVKTRSLVHILEKPCVPCFGVYNTNIFSALNKFKLGTACYTLQ